MLDDPRAIPGKTLSYAKYDVVRVLNSLMEALRLDQSSLERLVGEGHVGAGAPVPPHRARSASWRRATATIPGRASLRGTYQSPILVQWQPAERQERRLDISIVQLS